MINYMVNDIICKAYVTGLGVLSGHYIHKNNRIKQTSPLASGLCNSLHGSKRVDPPLSRS